MMLPCIVYMWPLVSCLAMAHCKRFISSSLTKPALRKLTVRRVPPPGDLRLGALCYRP